MSELVGTINNGTSVFDPVLTEICYKWFTPNLGAKIIDPFAGGSVRGIVASKLGYEYYGCDLREEQIVANRKQAEQICEFDKQPVWVADDSKNIQSHYKDIGGFDLVFSCPPYADLEVYSDNVNDISNMSYDNFVLAYSDIIYKTCEMLKDNRFAIFIVGEVRDKKGFYYNFVDDTKRAFEQAGCKFYNEIVLVNVAGTLPLRVSKTFPAGRKIGKMHQNVLVFYKGDPNKIKTEFSVIEIEDFEQDNNNDNIAGYDVEKL
jgi:16S rRNA G966 N2-methylase RsmD